MVIPISAISDSTSRFFAKGADSASFHRASFRGSREISFRAPALLLNGGLSFSFSKSLRGSRVNLCRGGQAGNFATIPAGGPPLPPPLSPSLEKRLASGPLYRDVDRKFLDLIPLSTRGARESHRIQRISGLLLLYRPVVT